MADAASDAAWKSYAITGRPDFLNYLRRGDVTWSVLWAFYRAAPAEANAMGRLVGLFHAFLCADFEQAGSILDTDGDVYLQMRDWADFAVEAEEFLPEEKIRDGLAWQLSQSLISPLYFEAACGVYLEARLLGPEQPELTAEVPSDYCAFSFSLRKSRELNIRLPGNYCEVSGALSAAAVALVDRHWDAWNQAYQAALGSEDEEWTDEGGEG